jgi:ubiquinone/menaquinone biosynthesis C-methylase UbiE
MESVQEGARLEAKTDAKAAAQQLRSVGLAEGMRAVDMGCGTGAVTRVMARLAGPGRVVGVDLSASRLATARELANRDGLTIDFRPGLATSLPAPTGFFDFSWARFLFQYLPEPELALRELVRVTRPGGIVAVADLDGQLDQIYPMDPALRVELVEAMRLLGSTGFDPLVGRKLFSWFQRAGLVDVSVQVQPYQVYAGGVPDHEWSNWQTKLAVGTQRLVDLSGERPRWEAFRDDYLAWLRRPDVFYYASLILVRGTVSSVAKGS